MSDAREKLQLSDRDRLRLAEVDALIAARDATTLVAQLDDRSWAVRRSIVGALARLGAASIPGLCEVLLNRRDNEARIAAAVDALALVVDAPDDALFALTTMASANAAVLCDIAQVFGRRRTVAAASWLALATAHSDDNVSVAAIEALGRIGRNIGAAAIDALIDVVSGGNFFRTFPALEVLGQSGDARAVPALIEMLSQPLYVPTALRALGHAGDERAIAPLARLLLSPQDDLVQSAASAIDEIHGQHSERYGAAEPIVTALQASIDIGAAGQRLGEALRGATTEAQLAICHVLDWLGAATATRALIGMLESSPLVAAAATNALKHMGERIDPIMQAELANATNEGALRVQLLALAGGRAENSSAVAACLADRDPTIRVAACNALGRIGDTRHVDTLFARLSDPDARVVLAAVGAIQSLGSERTEELALALAAPATANLSLRRAAMRIVAYFGYPRGLDVLLLGMHDADERLRDVAIGGLPFLDDKLAMDAILEAATHSSAKTRAAAMRALGQRSSTFTASVALRRGLVDTDAWVRYYACQALGRSLASDADVAIAIIALLHDPAGHVRVAAIDALAQIEATHEPLSSTLEATPAFGALCAAAESDDRDVQRAALLGLSTSKRDEALQILLAASSSTDAATRLIALAGVAQHDGDPVIATLAHAAVDRDESVRNAAVAYLATRDSQAATIALCALLGEPVSRAAAHEALTAPHEHDRSEWVLDALAANTNDDAISLTVGVLARLATHEANLALCRVLATPARFGVAARLAAAHRLGELDGDVFHRALERAAVDDADPAVRQACALALGE